jgi:type IV pilus assembly protein PilY1
MHVHHPLEAAAPMRSNRTPRTRKFAAGSALALASALLFGTPTVQAEDIDIYGSTSSASQAPNILFFLDNTSNWSANNQAWSAYSVWTNPYKCSILSGAAKTSCVSSYQADSQTKTNIEAIFYYGIAASSAGGKKRPWESGFSKNSDDISLKQGQVEVRALRQVLNNLVCNSSSPLNVNVGLMLWDDNGSVRSNGDRPGYIYAAVKPLSKTASGNSTATCTSLVTKLTTIDSNITNPSFKGPSNADYGSALFEVFKYFGGYTNPSGASTSTAGAPIGPMGYGNQRFSNPTTLEDGDAFTDATKQYYNSPINTTGGCGNNYLVLIGNAYPNAEPNPSPASFSGNYLKYTPTALPADTSRWADEWAQFMANTDVNAIDGVQRIYTYAMNVFYSSPDSSQTALLKSMAQYGGVGPSGYVEVGGDVSGMVTSLQNIVTSVAAVNSVFTATTLPVSTTTQGTYLNQIYVGMFRPDGDARPRWWGNLKQYKAAVDSNNNIYLADKNGNSASQASTGYFSNLATSFWTTDSIFFNASPSGSPLSGSDAPDGAVAEKGGIAEQLRITYLTSQTNRKIYTLPSTPTSGTALNTVPFDTTNTTVKSYFTTDEIAWVRGANNVTSGNGAEFSGQYKDSSGNVQTLGTTGIRPSVHGDVLHSRPVALNYGSGKVVVYYGANDGFFRAIDGAQTTDTSSTAGQELWSFIAPEHYSMLKRQRNDTPDLYLPATDSSGGAATQVPGTAKKDYAMDGPIGVFARYTSAGAVSEAIIYPTMRRGGSAVYAFDVSDPSNPKLKWKISNASSGFTNLGQTWSMPKPVIFPSSFSADPIIFMGGGYDPQEDSNGTSGVGTGVYIINGRTGALLKYLSTDYSVPADVAVTDLNGDGIYDRGYVADVRGNLYRISMTDSSGALMSVDKWTIKKIATLGGKVFFAPDVIPTSSFVSVSVGTGDREKPLLISTSDNFFLVKDTLPTATERTSALSISDLAKVAQVDDTSFLLSGASASSSSPNGCYIKLSTKGEKVVNAPYSIAGVTYFGTNRPTPSATSCTGSLGEAKAYQFPLFCGMPTNTTLATGGLPPSPVGGFIQVTKSDGTTVTVPFVIGSGMSTSSSSSSGDGSSSSSSSGGDSGNGSSNGSSASTNCGITEICKANPGTKFKTKRTYWHLYDGNR